MKNLYFTVFFCFIFATSKAQSIPSPSEFLGYELGTQFTRHHQVVAYFEAVAAASDQVNLSSYGKTYEGRTLQIASISSAKNLNNINEIRENHLINSGLKKGTPSSLAPVSVVWLSYNVHGNEAVSTEAALKTIYTLVTEKSEWLENLVVLMDPCINPDGRDRYVNWYNQVKSTPFDSNPIANEHYEEWPTGRTNHYYFDLNRDWAWVSQRETQQRLKVYHQWYPQVHVDFHEQGVNSPYYFAPAAEPLHEIVTDFQRDFQNTIGKNHASYFDKEGWSYFTKEVYDLLYPGYGDTYPMFHGAIGMTYEQGGSGRAGLSIKNEIGDYLTLKDRIDHHYTTGLSTIETVHKNSELLNSEFKKYFTPGKVKYANYVIDGDPKKIASLTSLLDTHHIPYSSPKTNMSVKGWNYDKQKNSTTSITKKAIVIDGKSQKNRLIQALFEPNTKIGDSVTYDITSWSLPYAYGLKAIATQEKLKNTIPYAKANKVNNTESKAYAYASPWKSFQDGKFLAALLKQNIRVRYNGKPIKNKEGKWTEGSLFILKGENKALKDFDATIKKIADNTNQKIKPIASGFSEKGIDLGSNEMNFISKKKVGLIKSNNASPQGYGEVWHFFEQQLKYPITQIDLDRLNDRNLDKFDILILPPGYYRNITDSESELIKWIRKGGRIIVLGSAVNSFADSDSFDLESKSNLKENKNRNIPFSEIERNDISSAIYGSIYKVNIDNSHPLAFGYDQQYYSLKNSEKSYSLLDNTTIGRLPKNAKPVAGFSGSEATKLQSESLIFGIEYKGRGSVVYLVDNPLYRAFWENGKLWMVNAIFH
ncbi:M14 family metallopeptidase [Flavobacteriaceae bacterium]|nr:M14 family metallopeptidase [Flavobacteriaceae bacterium]